MQGRSYGIAALLMIVAANASGAEVKVMDEVVVTAGRIGQAKKEVSANVTVVGREEIEQAAARTVGDLFAEMGISHIQKYPGTLTSIAIRGFRTETHGNDLQGHVLVLLDGRRAGTGNMAKILTRNVERIEIIRGPGAVQYGSGGVGGVVNIITRQGKANAVSLEAGGGSFDEYEGSLGATAMRGNLDFAGTVTLSTIGDYKTGGETYPNTGNGSQVGVSLNGGYTFSPGNRLGLIITGFNVEEAGNPGYIALPDTDDYTDKKNYTADLRYEGRNAAGSYQWMARYFFGRDENSWTYPVGSNPDFWDFGETASNDTDQHGAQAQVSTTLGPATLVGGLDWVGYEVENSWTPQRTEYSNPALFLLGKGAVLDGRLMIDGGLRYDWYEVKVSRPAGRSEEDSRLTPSIGLAWLATDALKLRGRYAEGFVMPAADQLAADYWNWGVRTVGNPNLGPEKSKTYDIGVDYEAAGFQGSLTYFDTDFTDKITNIYLADGTSTWTNLGSATIRGFEAEMSYDLGVPMDLAWELKPYLSLTLLTDYKDEETGLDLLYISGTTFSTGLVVADGSDWFCRFNVAYSGSQDVQDWAAGIYPVPVIEMDSFVVADLTASYRFFESEQAGSWSVRGELRNMFDEEYAYVLGNPMPGRSFFLGLRWEY